jgi:hypothetical protein
MYGNGIMHYLYDDTTKVASMKMRYQPMIKIVHDLIDSDLKVNTVRNTSNQDIYKQFPSSYGPITDWGFKLLSNQFRTEELGLSARTQLASDSEYNDSLREACKMKGLIEARKITRKQSGLRYRGSIALKGTHINPGDLIRVTNPFVGLNSLLLRVTEVAQTTNKNSWETILSVEEDEKRVGGTL